MNLWKMAILMTMENWRSASHNINKWEWLDEHLQSNMETGPQ